MSSSSTVSQGFNVYSRRPVELHPPCKGDSVGDLTENVADTNPSAERRQRSSWIQRSLSSRRRSSSIVDGFSFSVTQPESSRQVKQILTSPNVRRKKKISAPVIFLQEQKTYFHELDAFELEEESPSPKTKETRNFQPLCAELADAQLFRCCHSLEVVHEDAPAELLHETAKDKCSTNRDSLSLILKTPCNCKKAPIQVDTADYLPSESVGSGGLPESSDTTREFCSSICIKDEDLKASHVVSLADLTLHTAENILHMERLRLGICNKVDEVELHKKMLDDSKDKNVGKPEPEITVINDSYEDDVKSSVTTGIPDVKDKKSDKINESIRNLCLSSPDIEIEKHCSSPVEESRLRVQESRSLQGLQANESLLPTLDSLLQACGQVKPITQKNAISKFCNIEDVVKIGEGTFGEAFRGNKCVFKIVPMGGGFQVNGENQKTCAEIYSEAVLSLSLNKLRGGHVKCVKQDNVCRNFIEVKGIQVCQGRYDADLVHAWEAWDDVHASENQHPQIFPEKQLFVIYALADGGTDLEHFVLANFDEAKSILLQVTWALAIGEAACAFEHRDLHWGNILITRHKVSEIHYRLRGKDIHFKDHGVFVHLIDYTLARIHTGKQIFFCNLSTDPELFRGPTANVQAVTYRRMLKLTKGQWEARFLKTNCYWIHYLADILLHKKTYPSCERERRALRAFRKRVLLYDSAEAALCDEFFDQ